LDLNVSRQVVIKTFIRQAPDQHYSASRARSGNAGHRALVGL
jgi:hypothetical protein